jgi:6-phosphofructo-2-kinase/fructose-2,6-biphosphatase 2
MESRKHTDLKLRCGSVNLGTNPILGQRFIFAFVGLPARGKSYLSRKLATFLNWMGYETKVFSIGLYRRHLIGVNCDWTFFEEDNKETLHLREMCVKKALNDMLDFLILKGGSIGIIDGTNIRKDKRRNLEDYIKENFPPEMKYSFIWIESICTVSEIVEQNILKNKLKSPDYKDWTEEKAVKDFRDRINTYEKVYDHLSAENEGEEGSFIQLVDYNSEIIARNIKGFLPSKVFSFLVNLVPSDRPIYFTRHGSSKSSSNKIVGGDSELTPNGLKYAECLYKCISQEESILKKSNFKDEVAIYCSTLQRSFKTADYLSSIGRVYQKKCLDDINAGVCEGLSYAQIEEKYPKEYEERANDKLNYRYPRGESYKDVIIRLEPIIHELERRLGPVIVIGHQATLRCLYGYFTNTPLDLIPFINIPLHTVIKKNPQAFGINETRVKLNVETGEFTQLTDSIPNFEDNLYNVPEK